MVIPNIWENKIDVPNHQPVMPLVFPRVPKSQVAVFGVKIFSGWPWPATLQNVTVAGKLSFMIFFEALIGMPSGAFDLAASATILWLEIKTCQVF